MENNRFPQYEQGCSPEQIGNPPENMHPYEKRELVKKIIKRQIAEYQVGIFTINPKNYRWNLISKPYLESPSLPNNYIEALAYVHEHHNAGAPRVEEMDDRNDNPEEPVIPDLPTATEVINVPIVDSVLYQPISGRVNTLVFNQNEINALRIEQDNWLYDNINYINKIELVCNPKAKCCITITLTGAFIGLGMAGLGGKRKSKRKTKRRKIKKTKRKKRVSCKGRSTCKK
tara:strand:+ start:1855 stop:2544 length:690 start_codon:yes stop_codon:yes gene_type:complete